MNHQKIITSILVLTLVALSSPVFAEENNSRSRRPSTTTVRTKIEARRASSTERRVEMQQSLAKRKAEHTTRVLTATIERLEKIIVRLESRVSKVKAAGGTATLTEAFIIEARRHLSLATSSIATFTSLDLSGDKAQENFEKVRALAREVKSYIREAHRSLMNAVRALKGASSGE